MSRVGVGYDVHPWLQGKPLVLCGVQIPGPRGLNGNSDADVAVHALIDALLGASGKGDIGRWFPPDDPRFHGAPSSGLLATVVTSLHTEGWSIENADLLILTPEPRLAPWREAFTTTLAEMLSIAVERVNVKLATGNGIGAVAQGEGVAALAAVSLTPPQ